MSGPHWLTKGRVDVAPSIGTDALLATKGAVPFALDERGPAVVTETGEVLWVQHDGQLVHIDIAPEVLASDEIHVSDTGVIGTTVDASGLTVVHQGWSEPTPTTTHLREADAWTSDAYCVITEHQITAVQPRPEGRMRITAHRLAGPSIVGMWSVDLDLPSDFEVVSAFGRLLIARADDGVMGDRLLVLSVTSGLLLEVASDHGSSAWHVQGGVYVVRRSVSENSVTLVQDQGEVAHLRCAEAIASVGGDRRTPLLAVFDGTEEYVAACTPSERSLLLTSVSRASGKKTIGQGVMAWLSRGVQCGLVYETPDSQQYLPLGTAGPRSIVHEVARSEEGATALRWRSDTQEPAGLIVHLHGGPEAYETDELRMFGLVSDVVDDGWEWRSLNYRGSRSGDSRVTSAAWHCWADTFGRDLQWLLDDWCRTQRPVVLIGWSFGAALALAVTRHLEPAGLIIGGTMGPLASHRSKAIDVDPAHADWFDRRFDVKGADGRYFDGRPPDQTIRTRVLSFHGENDEHCPYSLFTPVHESWRPKVRSWEHHDLVGGTHYPEQIEDADLVRSESRRLLHELAMSDARD